MRVGHGLSLDQLGAVVGYSKSQLSKIERGQARADVEFARLCDRTLGTGSELEALVRGAPALPAPMMTVYQPAQLPTGPPSLLGREADIAALDRMHSAQVAPDELAAIIVSGAPGVGKTALVLHWAETALSKYPDGQFFVDLRGYDDGDRVDPADVLEDWLAQLGVPPTSTPDTLDQRTALFRSVVDRRRILIVLDNASSSDQVLPLLPASPGCLVVVTSRCTLSSLTVRTGATRHTVASLSEQASLELLSSIIGHERVARDRFAAAEVTVQRCAGLPLAIRVAAEYLLAHEHEPLHDLADQLAEQGRQLELRARYTDTDAQTRNVFSWSIRHLPRRAEKMFRLLGAVPKNTISVSSAAALGGITDVDARNLLVTLSASHLIEPAARDRYHLHDLLRSYAAEQAAEIDSEAWRNRARLRLLAWYLRSAWAANAQISRHDVLADLPVVPDLVKPMTFDSYAHAVDWCNQEIDSIVDVVMLAHRHQEHTTAWMLAVTMMPYLTLSKANRAWRVMHEVGLAAAQAAHHEAGQAWCLHNLAHLDLDQRHYPAFNAHLDAAIEIRASLGDRRGLGRSMQLRAQAQLIINSTPEAANIAAEAMALHRACGDEWGIAATLTIQAAITADDNPDAAIQNLRNALTRFEALDDDTGRAAVLVQLASIHGDAHSIPTAMAYVDQAITLRTCMGDICGQAQALMIKGDALLAAGDVHRARRVWCAAEGLWGEMYDPRASDARAALARLDVTPTTFPVGRLTGGQIERRNRQWKVTHHLSAGLRS